MLFNKVLKKARLWSTASLCFFVLCLFTACAEKPAEFYAFSGSTMGTSYSIKVVAEADEVASAADIQQQVETALQAINQAMSTYIADSELSQLNQASMQVPFKVSAELMEILLLSHKISEQSAGAFDVTVGPLVNLWGFGPEELKDKIPEDEVIEALKQSVGYQKLELDQQSMTATKMADIYVDLSALAKGWAVDALAGILLADGSRNFMVEIGGELRIFGNNPSGKPWTIGIESPSLLRGEPQQAIASSDAAIATSGDYRNYREVDGKRFSHTINPVSGKPITHKLASVTVVSDTAAKADAYATTLNVLGPEEGLAFAEKHQIAAYFIVRDGEKFTSFESKHFKPYKVKL